MPYEHMAASIKQFKQKHLFVSDAMNDEKVSSEWVAFLKRAASTYAAKSATFVETAVSGLCGIDESMLHALSTIDQRPIVIIDAAKTEASGKISGICFSGAERTEFAISADRDIRNEFHPRTLFVLQDGRRFSALVSGEEPSKMPGHHDL